MTTANQEFLIIKQKVEVLAGERGDPRQAAIRMVYIDKLQELVERLSISTINMQKVIGGLNTDVSGIVTSIDKIEVDLKSAQDGLLEINNELAILKDDLDTLNGLHDELEIVKGSVDSVTNDVSTLKQDVSLVIVPAMNQGNIAAAPTAAQFNNLVADVGNLRSAIIAIKDAIV